MSKIVNACKQIRSEFKMITAPSPKKLVIQTAFVIAVSIVCAALITLMDHGAGSLIEKLM